MGGTALDQVLQDLLVLNDAKHRLHDLLLEMSSSSADGDLGLALREHALLIEDHVRRMADVFGRFGAEAGRDESSGMTGIAGEYTSRTAGGALPGDRHDLLAAATALKGVHYTMAASTELVIALRALGRGDAGVPLEQMLDEEAAVARRIESLLGLVAQRAGRDVRRLPAVQPADLLPEAAAMGATQPGVIAMTGRRKGSRKRGARRA